MNKRILIACEFSATVRDAFRARGFNAWSCDPGPGEGDPKWHYTGDVLEVNREKERSRTYSGIAAAMADQWGAIL